MQAPTASKPYYDFGSLCRAGARVILIYQLIAFGSGILQWVGAMGMTQTNSHRVGGVWTVSSPSNPLASPWIAVMLIVELALWLLVAHVLFWRSDKIASAIEGGQHRRTSS